MPWPADEVRSDPTLGLALCRLAMGLDVLYRHTRSAGSAESALAAEGLVPVDLWRGAPLDLGSWSAAASAVSALQEFVDTVVDPVRRAFLHDTLVSLGTFVAWQAGTDNVSFRERASRLLGRGIEPLDTLGHWRRELTQAIGKPVLDWERSRALDLNDVPEVFNRFAAEAYARSQQIVGELPPRRTHTAPPLAAQPQSSSAGAADPAPPHLMRLELVRDVPYTGYCDYLANTMRMNADQTFTPERLKLLVLHEAYPGHDYHLWRREHEVQQGQQPLDSLLVITNTPSSPLFEGIGDNGAAFLDWLDPTEQLHFDLGKLRSAACVNACLMLHEDNAPPERVRDFLIEEGCAAPTWAATRLRFMQDPLRAPFVFSYYLGYRAVAEASAAWRGTRADFFTCLYGRMHSPRSLALAAALSDLEHNT
jgi:hypothetical protein